MTKGTIPKVPSGTNTPLPMKVRDYPCLQDPTTRVRKNFQLLFLLFVITEKKVLNNRVKQYTNKITFIP